LHKYGLRFRLYPGTSAGTAGGFGPISRRASPDVGRLVFLIPVNCTIFAD